MSLFLILVGSFELWRLVRGKQMGRAPGALCLGAGLLLAGLGGTVEGWPSTDLSRGFSLALLVAGLVFAWRDGTLRRTYACWARDRSAGRGTSVQTPGD